MVDGITLQEIDSTLSTKLQKAIDQTENDLAPISATLNIGTGVYSIIQDSGLGNVEIEGRTLINKLGNLGNGESLSAWTRISPIELGSISTEQKKSGLSSMKLSYTGHNGYYYIDFDQKLNSFKYYIAACWVYVESYVEGTIFLGLYDKGTDTPIRYSTAPNTTIIGKWQLTYIKIPASNTISSEGFRIVLGGSGISTAIVYFDEVRLYEVSATIYNAIGTTHVTEDKIDSLIPYVDTMKSVFNPYIISEGKNLISPFNKNNGLLSLDAKIIDQYKLTIQTTTTNNTSIIYKESVTVGRSYTLSATFNGRLLVNCRNSAGGITLQPINYLDDGTERTISESFTIPVNTASLEVVFHNGTDVANEKYISNPMLNLGSTPLPFEPQNKSYQFFKETLCSNVDGTVRDKLYRNGNGEYRKIKKFKQVDLDGSFSWLYENDQAGFKIVVITSPTFTDMKSLGSHCIVKYDGKIIKTVYPASAPDQGFIQPASPYAYVSISDADSGWGETYIPTPAEIKTYFNGYLMYTDGGGTYNGTGGKYFGTRTEQGVFYVSTNVAPTTLATNFTPYKLQYELATPIDVPVETEGALEVFEGLNQITVGSGVIIREEVADIGTYAGDGSRHINFNSPTLTEPLHCPLPRRVSKILAVYKDGNYDEWLHFFNGSEYGNDRVAVTSTGFDTTASYSVTYFALDMYKLGIAPQSISAKYQGNLADVVKQNVSDIVEANTQISIIKNEYAKKQQGGWIVPTLLNGWVNHNEISYPTGYYKDSLGRVYLRGLIKNGTVTQGTIILKLPNGYIPEKKSFFTVDNALSSASVFVNIDGTLVCNVIHNNGTLSLEGISFRAEQ